MDTKAEYGVLVSATKRRIGFSVSLRTKIIQHRHDYRITGPPPGKEGGAHEFSPSGPSRQTPRKMCSRSYGIATAAGGARYGEAGSKGYWNHYRPWRGYLSKCHFKLT